MEYVNFSPRAKINVSLDVCGKLKNGYHEVKMIMQTLKLHDDLFIKKTNSGCIELKTNHPFIPTDEKNLVYKACDYLIKEFNLKSGLYIELFKRIPVEAGLGGGSSDAAAALKAMRKLFSLDLSDNDLAKIAVTLGADVPFFIRGGTALAQGIGEKLTSLPKHPYVHVLVMKPDFNVSTAGVYKALNLSEIQKHPDTDKIIDALSTGDIRQITDNMYNVLETVTVCSYPVINQIKAVMKKHGALTAMMCGSGSSVFGYFINRQSALKARYALYNQFGLNNSIFLTGTL